MNILIDLRYQTESGVSSFIRDFMPPLLARSRRPIGCIKYQEQHFEFENDLAFEIICPTKNIILEILWSNFVLPKLLKEKNVSLYQGVKWAGPLLTSVPSVSIMHSIAGRYKSEEFPLNLKTWLYIHLYHKWGIKRSHKVIAVSDFVKDFLIDNFKVSPSRVVRIYCGVSPDFRVYGEDEIIKTEKWIASFGKDYMLCVGSLISRKNYILAIRALWELRDQISSNLVIAGVGQGGYDKFLQDEVARLGLENRVFFPGFVRDEALISLMNGAKIFVHPSRSEQFGLVLTEAASCGLPYIVTKTRGAYEFSKDCALILEDPDDEKELAKHILSLFEDENLYKKIQRQCLAMTLKFNWEKTVEDYLAIYDEVLQVASSGKS